MGELGRQVSYEILLYVIHSEGNLLERTLLTWAQFATADINKTTSPPPRTQKKHSGAVTSGSRLLGKTDQQDSVAGQLGVLAS